MNRLTKLELHKISRLTKSGSSLNKISENLSIPKTTVYYHFKKIKGPTYSKPVLNFNSPNELGEVIGIFSGDGSSQLSMPGYHYLIRVHFGIKNPEYTTHVKSLFEKGFGKNFLRKNDGSTKEVL